MEPNALNARDAPSGPLGTVTGLSFDQACNVLQLGEKNIEFVLKLQAFAKGYITRMKVRSMKKKANPISELEQKIISSRFHNKRFRGGMPSRGGESSRNELVFAK